MQKYFEDVTQKYNEELKSLSVEDLTEYIRIQKQIVNNLHSGIENNNIVYTEGYKRIRKFIEQYKLALKEALKENGNEVIHITSISPDNLKDMKLKKSIGRMNNYETEKGDWFFASSSPVDASNFYLARNSTDGMINLGKNVMVYGGNNLVVNTNEDGKKRLILSNPNYIYHINADGFEPVVNLGYDKNGNISLNFSEEWIIPEDIDITDQSRVRRIEKIKDVTFLLEKNQIFEGFMIGKEPPIANKIRKSENPKEEIKGLIKSGRIRYINLEAGINMNNELVPNRSENDIIFE